MGMNSAVQLLMARIPRFIALWRYKGFIFNMVWREFKGRYLNSLLGSLWSILSPMAMIIVYTVIFSKIMRARLAGSDDSMAYGLFLCAGLLPWSFFSELLLRCQNIFIENAGMLKKVSFPRSILPVMLFLSAAINFGIIFGLFLLLLGIFGRFPGWAILGFLPLLLVQQTFTIGLGMFLGTINVFFRDIGHFVGIILQFWFWFTPIVYPVNILPNRAQNLIPFNPMTQFIMSYQEIILYGHWPQWGQFRFHILGSLVFFAIGFLVFRKLSGEIVDEL